MKIKYNTEIEDPECGPTLQLSQTYSGPSTPEMESTSDL